MAATSPSARERMLASAVELFQRHGVDATALSDIVEHSGAPRGSLYHYFPEGKSQLAAEAIAQAGRQSGALITGLVATHGPEAAVRMMIGYYRQQLVDSDFLDGCPTAAGALEGGDAPGARQAAGETFTSWESTIAAALWQHGIAAEQADRLATLAIAAIEGGVVIAKAQGSSRALDRVEAELVAHLHALLPA